jgi:Tfp pilus assembly PilM family ATPase
VARFLALDWAHNRLHVLSATAARGKVRFERAAVLQEGQALTLATAETLGQRLRERLKAAGISPAPLLVCIGRDQVVLKEIRYPKTSAEQEPAVVRFQATKELTDAPDAVVIDYTRLDRPGPAGEQRAWVLIARRDLINAYQALAKAANLKLLAVTPRPFGIAACLRRLAPAQENAAGVLAVADGWAEFCVARGDTLLFARPLPPESTNLLGEVRRNLSLYAGQPQGVAGTDAVAALYVTENGGHAALREQLGQLLAIPVQALDPFAAQEQLQVAGDRGGYTGAAGLAYLWAERNAAPVNFAAPKEPKPPVDTRRRKALRYAGLAFLAVLALVFGANLILAGQRARIEELREQKADAEAMLNKLQPEKRAYTAIKEWQDTALPVLDEIYDLAARFPFHAGMRVNSLKVDTAGVHTNGKDSRAAPKGKASKELSYPVKILVSGVVRRDDTDLVRDFIDAINRDKYCHATNEGLQTAGNTAGPQGLQDFKVVIEVAKRPASAYTTRLVPPAASTWERRDRP